MREKNFIRQTKPKGERETRQAIKDIERQIHYWKSIGEHEYDISYWGDKKKYLEDRLEGILHRKGG